MEALCNVFAALHFKFLIGLLLRRLQRLKDSVKTYTLKVREKLWEEQKF